MEKFIWRDDYSVGIPSLDEQHKRFFDITNEVIDLVERGDITKEALVSAAEKLADYAFYHFQTEEDYFKKFSYPDAPAHVDAHNFYRKRMEYYRAEVEDPRVDLKKLADEIFTASVDWLTNHILVMDKKYGPFLRERGVK